MKILVTGGNGFVGTTLVKHLVDANYKVRVLAHHKKNLFHLEGLDIEVINGDITQPEITEKAVRGCSVIFNLASVYAFYPFWEKTAKALYKINVHGTTNILNAAFKNGVERFIHTSTIATIGKRPNGSPSDEKTGFDFQDTSHYARSKYLAEQEVFKFHRKGLPIIILNPGIVIGQGDYKPTPSGEVIVNFLNRKYPAYFDTLWPIADVDDVARAHIAALRSGKPGERYILCDKTHYSLRDSFTLLEEISGKRAPYLKIPYPLLMAFVYTDEFLSYHIFKKRPLMPTEGVKFCKMSITYDNSKAVSELGYSATPVRETLTKAVLWYRKNGYIEPSGFLRFKVRGSKKVVFIIKKLKINALVDKLNPGTIVFFFIVKFLTLLTRIGFKPKEDGWRKVTQSYLRTEKCKFALAVFRLDLWSDSKTTDRRTLELAKKHLIERLASFLQQHPSTHWQLCWKRFSAQRQEKHSIDIVHVKFHKNGTLESLVPYLDPENTIDISSQLQDTLVKGIVKGYNKTKDLPDKIRPLILKRQMGKWLLSKPELNTPGINDRSRSFIDRVLSAAYISFEKLTATSFDMHEKRFQAPSFIKYKHPGFGFLNILCRFTSDLREADLWIQFSHVPIDGVPMQEVLRDLKRRWGVCGDFRFPSPGSKQKSTLELCSTKNAKRETYIINDFVDFRPFLKYRRELNRNYAHRLQGGITTAALLMWKLSTYRVFEDIKFAVPVDLRATTHRERTLGFVFMRPNIYFDRYRPDRGFLKFQQEFNQQLRATWKRRSESYKLLDSYSLASPAVYSLTSKLLSSVIGEFVGTLGLTIIKKADLFIAPLSDIHKDGFIAISNFFNVAEDGKKVCSVSIKGPKDKIEQYLEAIKEVAGSGN